MKIGLLPVVLLLCVPVVSVDAAPAKLTKKVARRTVVDYFRLLPDDERYFGNENRLKLLRKGTGVIIDLKHDYLRSGKTRDDEGYPPFQIAVFRYGGRDVVAVTGVAQGDYFFDLLRYERGKWTNVTEDLSPPVDGDDLYFKLPRYGTTIQVLLSDGTLNTKLFWKQGVFVEGPDPTG